MSSKEYSININPKIITQGGQVNIEFSFIKDPFTYKESDFLINNIPLKMIYMNDRSFKGEINQPLEAKMNELSVKINKANKVSTNIFVPEILISPFHQLENNVFFDQEGNMLFLDIKKIGDQFSPILCHYNFLSSKVERSTLGNTSINSIYINHHYQIFASSIKDKAIYKVEDNLELSLYAQGLGAPFGMTSNHQNQLFVADQKGSLFLVEEKKAVFLSDIPTSIKGYYLAAHPITGDIYISTPNYAGKNTLIFYNIKNQKIDILLESYNLLGAITFDQEGNFYWVEHTREESIIYIRKIDDTVQKLISGQFFMGIAFNEDGDLFLNDLHKIYKIEKGFIHV